MKIFQIFTSKGDDLLFCHYDLTKQFPTLESTVGKFAPNIIIVEAPDYVFEGWGYDKTAEGDGRFIKPTPPEGWLYDDETGTFYQECVEVAFDNMSPEDKAMTMLGLNVLETVGRSIVKRGDLVEQAEPIHAVVQIMARTAPDAVVFTIPTAFDPWATDTAYETGDVRRYGEKLYRCLTAHTSQSTWQPDVSPSLWVRIDDPAIEWPEWVQPTGSTDAYAAGAKVSHNGKHWASDVDANTWEPGVYGWTEVA